MHRLEIAQISPARDHAAEIGETGKLFTDRGNAVHFDPSIQTRRVEKAHDVLVAVENLDESRRVLVK